MVKHLRLLLLIAAISLYLVGCTARTGEPHLPEAQRVEFMMDTIIEATVYGQNADQALNQAFTRVGDIEKLMSKTLSDSDILKINLAAGQNPVSIAPDTLEVLTSALNYATLTDGAYEPTSLPIIELWGIGTEQAAVPSQQAISEALNHIGYDKLALNPADDTAFLTEQGSGIDLGGIVKGYAADEMQHILQTQKLKHGILYLGGSITVFGGKPTGQPWVLGIQNPIEPEKGHFATIQLYDGSLVTSGDYQRYFEENGQRYHHIMDPKTGFPVTNELASVTILTSHAQHGDALSTALFVMGLQKGLNFTEEQSDTEAIFVTQDQKVYLTSGLTERVHIVDGGFQIEKIR